MGETSIVVAAGTWTAEYRPEATDNYVTAVKGPCLFECANFLLFRATSTASRRRFNANAHARLNGAGAIGAAPLLEGVANW
jgi:hypothetical protein